MLHQQAQQKWNNELTCLHTRKICPTLDRFKTISLKIGAPIKRSCQNIELCVSGISLSMRFFDGLSEICLPMRLVHLRINLILHDENTRQFFYDGLQEITNVEICAFRSFISHCDWLIIFSFHEDNVYHFFDCQPVQSSISLLLCF